MLKEMVGDNSRQRTQCQSDHFRKRCHVMYYSVDGQNEILTFFNSVIVKKKLFSWALKHL